MEIIINPVIEQFSKEEDLFEEGCFSVEQYFCDVWRSEGILVQYQNSAGKIIRKTLTGI